MSLLEVAWIQSLLNYLFELLTAFNFENITPKMGLERCCEGLQASAFFTDWLTIKGPLYKNVTWIQNRKLSVIGGHWKATGEYR